MKKKPGSTAGAYFEVDPESGWISRVLIIAADDQQELVVHAALARLAKPSAWAWLRRLFKR